MLHGELTGVHFPYRYVGGVVVVLKFVVRNLDTDLPIDLFDARRLLDVCEGGMRLDCHTDRDGPR